MPTAAHNDEGTPLPDHSGPETSLEYAAGRGVTTRGPALLFWTILLAGSLLAAVVCAGVLIMAIYNNGPVVPLAITTVELLAMAALARLVQRRTIRRAQP